MNQSLKHKAFKLYLNKVDLELFEKDIYQLAEIYNLQKNKFLYELVVLNYKNGLYKKELYRILEKYSTQIELLSLRVYEKCMSIIESVDKEEIFSLINGLSNLCIEFDYNYDVLFKFYRLDDGISIKKEGFFLISDKEIINEAKTFSRQVIENFNQFKVSENWNAFLEELPDEIEGQIIEEFKLETIQSFIINSKLNFESNSKIKKRLKQEGYSNYEINEFFKNAKEEISKKSNEKALAFLVIGVVFTLVGTTSIFKGITDILYVWIFLFVGVGCIYTALSLYNN